MKQHIFFFSIDIEYVRPSTWTQFLILALCVFEFDTPGLEELCVAKLLIWLSYLATYKGIKSFNNIHTL